MGITDIKISLSEVIGSVGDKMKDSLSFLKDLKESGADKLNTLVNDVLGLSPLIEATGFDMTDIAVDIGIPPGISISFIKEKDVDPETIDQMLEENKDKEMLKIIVRALQKADAVQKGMNLSNYKFRGLSMKLGLPPDMSLKFAKE
ncbi:MAG: hypothetical protein ACHQET_12760 [Chitinophagales bacterium]